MEPIIAVPHRATGLARHLTTTLAVMAALGVTYVVFLAWDQEKYIDPATGRYAGPYESWQIAAVGLCFTAIVATGALRSFSAVVLAPIVLTVLVATATAAITGEGGLWVIGAALMLVGSGISAAVIGGITITIAARFGRRSVD